MSACHVYSICVHNTYTSGAHSIFQHMFSLSGIHQVLQKWPLSSCTQHFQQMLAWHAPSTCVPNNATRGHTASLSKCLACHAYIKACQIDTPCHAHNISGKCSLSCIWHWCANTATSGYHRFFQTVQPVMHTTSSAKGLCLSCTQHLRQMLSMPCFQHLRD